jgi:N-dimethylarginine dimethylaminohydrolase
LYRQINVKINLESLADCGAFFIFGKTKPTHMLKLNIKNETSRLRAVVLGVANSNGPTPSVDEAYDPKSLEHILAGTYPKEADMIPEMEAFNQVFKKYEVTVYRPEIIENYNQIFARDIGFVIDDVLIKSNILPDRERELDAIQYVIDQINPAKFVIPPVEVHIEGGDVMLWNDYIFIGTYKGSDYKDYITARTNKEGVQFIKELFPNKIVKEFDLIKSKIEARDNALHLDCCFQPVGENKGIIYKRGFREEADYLFLVNLFGEENLFEITRKEMYQMNSNVFSIDSNVVVSEKKFTRLNKWLRKNGFVVEEIPYAEIAKQEGLLRCSTLPLIRE